MLVREAARSLNFDASPGLGHFRNYSSNGQALGWDGLMMTNTINMRILIVIIRERINGLLNDETRPVDLKMFVKEEPISQEKILKNRQRLIFTLSLEDQVLDRVLFGRWHTADVKNFSQVPNKSGWTPVPEGFWLVKRDFPKDKCVLATDCTAFDWTLPGWVVPIITECKLLQGYPHNEKYVKVVNNRVKEVLGTDCRIRFPNGQVFRQEFPGLMKSGWLLTISFNGWAQFLINSLAWKRMVGIEKPLPIIWTMGDDVLLRWHEKFDSVEYEQQLRKLGVLVKPGAFRREFSGFEFTYEGDTIYCSPLYTEKHKFQLRHYSEEELHEVVDMYACIYALAEPSRREWFDPIQRQYGNRSKYWFECWAWGIPLPGHLSFKTSDFEY